MGLLKKTNMRKKEVLFILGTRPELIKMNPVIKVFKSSEHHHVKVCITSQHKELLHDLFELFSFEYDVDLFAMKPNQTLVSSFNHIMDGLNKLGEAFKPSLIFVQGDTTTAFAGALYGFYNKIKVAHIEAGLRSGDLDSPFPEEGNRKMITHIANYHFCPTTLSCQNLLEEKIINGVHIVGNTVIDSLIDTIKITQANHTTYTSYFERKGIDFSKKIILTTIHRRENYGEPLQNICDSIRSFTEQESSALFILPIHPNRNGDFIKKKLGACNGVCLLNPLAYDKLVFLMYHCHIVLTDSGGIQEEAITCNKPILILRDTTERQEVIDAGAGVLVYANKSLILEYLTKLFNDKDAYEQMIHKENPYGDGKASEKIFEILTSK
jgi:UDP-N-acetylglucosamine 2-epimerase (non-hydrolysing)